MSNEEVMLRAITSLEIKNSIQNKTQEDIKEMCFLSKEALRDIFEQVISILKDYVETSEENYKIIALWIIGTYFHQEFLTFPYLFFNAMRGSGKTRMLKLIKYLAKDGDMLASLSEAVLFRTKGTLCIDEFERIDSKEKNALRELLNTAYKKGGSVKRMKKKKTLDGESQVVEQFDTFRPICMANISGMEEVLGDRCIQLILEKSNNFIYTKKVEDFEWNSLIKKVLSELLSVVKCSLFHSQNIYTDWNKYINYTTTPIHSNTQNYTKDIPSFPMETEEFFAKLNDINIDGRNLELFFPLIMMAQEIGILEEFLLIVKTVITSKRTEEMIESKDINLYEFVAIQEPEWVNIKALSQQFRHFCNEDDTEDPWLNPRWIGKALKRLNLIKEKRRIGDGIQVKLNIEKARIKKVIFQ